MTAAAPRGGAVAGSAAAGPSPRASTAPTPAPGAAPRPDLALVPAAHAGGGSTVVPAGDPARPGDRLWRLGLSATRPSTRPSAGATTDRQEDRSPPSSTRRRRAERPDHAARAGFRQARPRAGSLRHHPAHALRSRQAHTVSQLSIPRDTLVNVPGHGQTKINEAYFWGRHGPAGHQDHQQFTGIPINHVMLVNFHGFPAHGRRRRRGRHRRAQDHHFAVHGQPHRALQEGPAHLNGKRAPSYVAHPPLRQRLHAHAAASSSSCRRCRRRSQGRPTSPTPRDRHALHERRGHRSLDQPDPRARLPQVARQGREYKPVLLGTPEMIGGGQLRGGRPGTLTGRARAS